MNDRYWLWLELSGYGYTLKDLEEITGYSCTTLHMYFKGTRKMKNEVLFSLLGILLLERKN